jgi:hypothetical protein
VSGAPLAGCGDDDEDAKLSDAGHQHDAGKDSGLDGGQDGRAQTLCDKYGGADNIAKVIAEQVVPEITMDCRIQGFFAELPSDHVTRLVECLSIQAQELFGCEGVTYAGSSASNGLPCRSMEEAHENMGVSKGDFDALVEDVVAGLSAAGVEEADIQVAAPALLGLESEIVEGQAVTPSEPMCTDDGGVGDAG